jgi:hypothetical protein
MGDPLFWLMLLRVLQTGIRTLGDLFMGAVETTSKIIGLVHDQAALSGIVK